MPKKTVHHSKGEALLQLCNIVNVRDVAEISDLGNGEILLQTIKEKFKLDSKNRACEEMNTSKEKDDVLEDENKPSCDISRIPDQEKNDILIRYIEIQKFIDDHYKIKSDDLISYEKCAERDKFEITKVITFVLCELVKLLLQMNNQDLQTLFHLEVKHQVELEEIFKLFITDRNKIAKDTVEKLLSKSAQNMSPFVTPRRTSLRHRNQTSPPEPPKEDVYTNSPLKNYFESPIFQKEDFWLKKQIESYAKTIEDDEEESIKQQYKLSEMEEVIAKKEKVIKKLQKELDDVKEDLQEKCRILEIKEEAMKHKVEGLQAELNNAFERMTQQSLTIKQRDRCIEEMENTKVERKSFSQQFCSILPSSPSEMIEPLQEEIAFLKEKNRNLELKMHTYKKQLSTKICSELCETNSPRKEENLARVIDIDYRSLFVKFNEANAKNEKLLEEIEHLKKQAFNINQSPHGQKDIHSVATTTKTPEMEKLRNSLNQSNVEHNHLSDESSYILNNSDNRIPCEQSDFSADSEVLPPPEKPSEAVLWKIYDSEKSETESTNAINLNHDTVASENSHLDVISDCGLNNIQMKNIESNGLLNQENKYVIGNLNFDIFLDELKKLTKNGSFQKVLQVFEKLQNKVNGPNRSNRLGLQEMLQVITECVIVAVALNAESSFADLQDKCCWTEEFENLTPNQSLELEKLRNELKNASEKHNIELKEHKKEIEKLKCDKSSMELKCQTYNLRILQNNKTVCEMNQKLETQQIKIQKLMHKCVTNKEMINNLHIKNKRLLEIVCEYKKTCSSLKKKYRMLEESHRKLIEEKEKILKEKGKNATVPVASSSKSIGLRYNYSEFSSTFNTDTCALPKNISSYISENEEDYFSFNKIAKEDTDNRIEEIKRRNSLYPSHLQSSYPIEMDLKATYDSLYIKDENKNCSEDNQLSKKVRRNSLYPSHLQSSYPIEMDLKATYDSLSIKDEDKNCSEDNRLSKKRKTDHQCLCSTSTPSNPAPSTSSFNPDTPISKPKKRVFSTPIGLQKLMKNMKYKNKVF